ncbi:curli production assembly/transport component CsgG domain protein [Leptospira santarosai str. HAI821]|uniref:CsgG/HfaB family protein n=1 Tax=Leptospira santarosai TaxID=28183 RepID=UPI0002BEDF36|nr:CsgG/HfaB family protein [Leptospira santarosai]EMO31244.1 curli production assembly/transport component CsgG domain protein [Leptospira santarosai str. HAI821]UZN09287.1 CsgG/HfaB family protein [Leptospira santarosai]
MFRSRFFSFQPIVFCFAAALTFQCVSTGNLSLESAISNFNQNEKRYRIGVIDFSNSEKQTSRYDSMISDLLIVELSKNSSNVLVERSKLAELLSEHSLQSSGLLDSDRAKELGKIIPIDLILTGSYTIKKINPREDIHISGRFIHVVTGEIVYAFNTTISREGQDSFVNPSNISSLPEKKCAANSKIEELLKDLSTESKIQDVVERARKISFEDECGKVHGFILSGFIRHKIDSKDYKTFLMDSLKRFQNPNEDYRAVDSLRYFQLDKNIDEEEWAAGKDVIQRVQAGHFTKYATYLLNMQHATNKNLILKRAEELMELGIQKKIGRPVALFKEDILLSLLYSLQDSKANLDVGLSALVLFDQYKKVVFDKSADSNKILSIFDFLSNHYFKESDTNKKEGIFLRIHEFLISMDRSDQKEKKLDDFLGKLISTTGRAKETDTKLYRAHFAKLFHSIPKEICEVTDKNPYPLQKSSRLKFLSENECECK